MTDKYFVNGGVNNLWQTSGNWSLTDGGAGGAGVPTSSDNVFFTALSTSASVTGTGRACLALNFTGFAGNFDLASGATLTASANVTLGAGMTLSGSGTLILLASGMTHTANGKIVPFNVSFSANIATYTFADAWEVLGVVTVGSGSTGTVTMNGGQIKFGSDFTHNSTSGILTGTTALIASGTGVITPASTTGQLRVPLEFNTSGTVTILSGSTLNYNTMTLKYTSGTIVTTGTTLNVSATTTTNINTIGMVWDNLIISGTGPANLVSDIEASGLTTVGSSSIASIINGSSIIARGGLRLGVTTGTVGGTTVIKLKGTGSVDAPTIISGRILSPLEIDSGAGTVTFTSPVYIDMGNTVYKSGSVMTTSAWASGGSNTPKAFTFVG